MQPGESHNSGFPWRLLVMTIAVLCAVFFIGEILLSPDKDPSQLASTDYNRGNKVGAKILTPSSSLAYAPKNGKKNKAHAGKKKLGEEKLDALLAKKGLNNGGLKNQLNKGLKKGKQNPLSSMSVKDILRYVDLKAPPFVAGKFSWESSNQTFASNDVDHGAFEDESSDDLDQDPKSKKNKKQNKAHNEKTNRNTASTSQSTQLDAKGRKLHRVILVKTHKTASTTLASMLIRMAEIRGLRIYVPPEGSVDAIRTVNPMKLPKPSTTGKLYDMWLLHTQFHPTALQRFVPGGLFLTSVRDAAERFVSGWFHLRGPQRSGSPTIEDYIRRVEAYMAKKEPLPPQLEQLRNSLAKELLPYPPGRELSASDPAFQSLLRDITDLTKPMIPKPVQTLGKTIKVIDPPEEEEMEDDDDDVGDDGGGEKRKKKDKVDSDSMQVNGQLRVILTDSFDEGVLSMAHDWNWSLNDVVYLSQNNGTGTHYPKDPSLDPRSNEKLMEKLRALNPLDQLVVEAARDAHKRRLQNLPPNWKKDLQALQDSNKKFQAYCEEYPKSKDCLMSKVNQALWLKIYRVIHPDNSIKAEGAIPKAHLKRKLLRNQDGGDDNEDGSD
eukprot:TRINITY_DN2296_c0_g1_i1.p1 TRINITY_DN2296_c0_g1~~TRINITY_DN2296_c0_g1_i1.p1  ORF type:complete len:607 (+),score=178.74 TRINITY_DN2296_c0_g1_i1:52-1872(+)